jgi:hypothetical protein
MRLCLGKLKTFVFTLLYFTLLCILYFVLEYEGEIVPVFMPVHI